MQTWKTESSWLFGLGCLHTERQGDSTCGQVGLLPWIGKKGPLTNINRGAVLALLVAEADPECSLRWTEAC